MEHATLLMILACAFGFFMAWGIGANDVANAMGTAVGSRSLTTIQVIIIATIFEAAGALLASGEVTETIRGKIVDPALFVNTPEILVYGMLASLLGSGVWLLIATHRGWPVSTTHSIVGAIIGFGMVSVGVDVVSWSSVGDIFLSWLLTPMIGGVTSYLLFMSVQKLILGTTTPLQNAKRYVPFYIFLVALIITLVTLFNGLKHLELRLSNLESLVVAILISVSATSVGIFMLQRIKSLENQKTQSTRYSNRFGFDNVEKVFAVLMVFTACAMAFAHGSNDVANAIGPLAAIIEILNNNGQIGTEAHIPSWIFFLGATGIVIGLATYGHKVIATIGENITELTPSRGFAATLATATTVVLSSVIGMPVSTTHTLVGAILGVGLARGIGALNLNVVRNIFASWLITLPAGAILTILFFHVIKWFFMLW